jgi:hypothetical protein
VSSEGGVGRPPWSASVPAMDSPSGCCRALLRSAIALLALLPRSTSVSPAASREVAAARGTQKYCTLGHGHKINSGCVAGRYTVRFVDRGGKNDPLSVHVSEACHPCPQGYFQPGEAAAICTECPAGKYQLSPSMSCCFDMSMAPTLGPTASPTIRPTFKGTV